MTGSEKMGNENTITAIIPTFKRDQLLTEAILSVIITLSAE